MSKLFLVQIMMLDIIYKSHNHFSKEKAELEADPEAEALPEVLTFCWKRKRQKRKRQKRKRLGWKRKLRGSAKNRGAKHAGLDYTILFNVKARY
jgi:hypothetical protein